MDARAMRAREEHRLAGESERLAGQHRSQRDHLIRELRADGWSYTRIAQAVECGWELVRAVCKGRVGPGTRARHRPTG